MSTIEWPDHLLTLADWERLPDDERFVVEVVEGVLALSARPIPRHQRVVKNLSRALDAGLPARHEAMIEVEAMLWESPLTIRIPDLVIVDAAIGDTIVPRVQASDVLLAVEVASDGTRRVDRVMKFAEYAEAGIPQYWLVDPDEPVTLTAFRLVGDGYERDGEFTGSAELRIAGHAVRLDLDALIAR